MAAIVTNLVSDNTPVAISDELILIDTNDVAVVAITPTLVKAIRSVQLTPINAAAAGAAATTYVTGPAGGNLYGAASFVLNSAVASVFSVVVRGTTA